MSLYKYKYRIESNRLKNWDYSANAIYFLTFNTHQHNCIFGEIENNKMILNDNGKIVENEILNSIKIRENWLFHNWIVMPNHVHILVEINKPEIINYNFSETKILPPETDIEYENLFIKKLDNSNVEMHGSASNDGSKSDNENTLNQNNLDNPNVEMNGSASNDGSKSDNENTLNQNNLDNPNVEMHGSAYNDNQNQNAKMGDISKNVEMYGSTSNENIIEKYKLSRKPKSISSFLAILKSKITVSINNLMNCKNFDVWQSNFHDHIVRNYDEYKKIYYYIENNPKKWDSDKFNPINEN